MRNEREKVTKKYKFLVKVVKDKVKIIRNIFFDWIVFMFKLKKYLFFNQIQLIFTVFNFFSFYSKTSYIFDNGSWPNSEVEPYGEDSPDALSSFSICLVGKFKGKKNVI